MTVELDKLSIKISFHPLDLFRCSKFSWTHEDADFTTVWHSINFSLLEIMYYPHGRKPTPRLKSAGL